MQDLKDSPDLLQLRENWRYEPQIYTSPSKTSRADKDIYGAEFIFQEKGWEFRGMLADTKSSWPWLWQLLWQMYWFLKNATCVSEWSEWKRKNLKKGHSVNDDLLTGYGWTTVNTMDSLQLLKREDGKSQSHRNHRGKQQSRPTTMADKQLELD